MIPFRPRRLFYLPLLVLCLSAFLHASSGAAEPIYADYSILVPSKGTGGFSPQNNLEPELGKDDAGRVVEVHLPVKSGKSATLVWWYASHVRKDIQDWPVGEGARLKVVVRSDREVVLNVGVTLQTAGGSAKGGNVTGVAVPAGKEVAFYPALPLEIKGGVSHVRISFSAQGGSLPPLTITRLSVGSLADASLEIPDETVWRTTTNPIRITGRAVGPAGGRATVKAFDEEKKAVGEWTAPLQTDGSFVLELDRRKLPVSHELAFVPTAPGKAAGAGSYPVFTYPLIDPAAKLSRVVRDGRHLMKDGKPFAFMGVNYTPFLLGYSRKADYELLARNFREMHDWGFTAIRLPIAMPMIQPARGVFPDNPEYKVILKKAGLDSRFFELLRYAVELGHHFNIRIVFDWHETALDPYRYFLGGEEKDRGTGKPGTPLAWLAMSDSEYPKEDHPVFVLLDRPNQVDALLDATEWMARAFKGNGAVLGFEVPYNEPHERLISNDKNWRWLTAQSALRVKQADPGALAFGMPSGWGHENVFISSTWLIPDLVDGMGPHFYVGNGPIPVREDASKRKYPYLAREVEQSLSLGLTALALPYSNVGYPVYNGEGGGHGNESFLPDLSRADGTRIQIEAQLFQAYAAGMAGYFEWTMWNFEFWKGSTVPSESTFKRYAPVYAAGPLDLSRAKVLFVQNPAADSNDNGHNHGAVRFARAALDLHLQPVHYMTDDQLVYSGQTMFSRGFEQVEEVAEGLDSYKAIIIDTRNVDKRALSIVRKSGLPILEFGEDKPIDVAAIGTFLEKSGVRVDRKTSTQFQIAQGPKHLVVYRRSPGDATRIYPAVEAKGAFELVSENGSIAFSGTSAQLATDGMPVDLPKWTSAIFTIRRR